MVSPKPFNIPSARKSVESVKSVDSKGLPRSFDVVVSLIGLVVAAPVIFASAVAVALTSPGGFLFRHERVGRHGEIFVLYKLRTMLASGSGPQITKRDDSRITTVGRFLRKTKLDELPTLWNVLRGDMALVGPRPEVPVYVRLSDPMWQTVLAVKPGVTDPVTLKLRNEQELLTRVGGDTEDYYLNKLQPSKLKGYVAYLEKRTWRSDLKVLWQTVQAVLFGARVPEFHPNGSTDPI